MSNEKNRPEENKQPERGGGGPPRGGRGHGGGRMRMVEKPKDMKGTFIRLIKYVGFNKNLFILLLAATLTLTALSLAGPALQERAINSITITESQLHVNFERLRYILLIMGITYAAQSLFQYTQNILTAKLSQSVVKKMRTDLFNKIVHLPISYLDTHRHGDIMSRMTNDIDRVSTAVSQSLASIVSAVITIIGTITIMLMYNPLMTLVSMVTIPLTIVASANIAKFARKYYSKQQKLLGELNGQAEEMITGYKTVLAFSKEKAAVDEFSEISNNLKNTGIRAAIFGGIMGPVMNIIGNLGYLIIAVTGGYLAFNGVITIGVIQAFLLYSKQFSRPINEVANQYAQIQNAIAGAERVFEIMDTPNEVNEGKTKLSDIKGNITFENVEFSYKPDEIVLRDFNLDIKAGEKIAIVGATGSGKTTVVNLLLRFYDIDKGRILIDGKDIMSVDKNSLRKNIAIVLQDTVLFSDTITNNLSYGREGATMEEIEEAARHVEAARFIELMPQGYDTVLSESGSNLSGGQRQLLAITRAVLADPAILILDEATSSVDTRTEMQIGIAMNKLMKNRTSLIIAHRLSTIRDADRIVVIDGGTVVEIGSHSELLARGGSYYNLYQSQFAGYET